MDDDVRQVIQGLRDWARGCEIAAQSWCEVFQWIADGRPIPPEIARERLEQVRQAFADVARTRQKLDELLGEDAPPRIM